MSKTQVKDLLDTLEECKIILRDEGANGVVRLQMPFRGGSDDEFKIRFDANDKKYTRYLHFCNQRSVYLNIIRFIVQ